MKDFETIDETSMGSHTEAATPRWCAFRDGTRRLPHGLPVPLPSFFMEEQTCV